MNSPVINASGLRASMGPEILSLGDYAPLRSICHRVKTGDASALSDAAARMASGIIFPARTLLIPVPSHLGYATDTLALCEELSRRTGFPVLDILLGKSRESLYLLKRCGAPMPGTGMLDMHLAADIPSGFQPVLVDNVIATGLTMRAALSAVPSAIPCAVAVDGTL